MILKIIFLLLVKIIHAELIDAELIDKSSTDQYHQKSSLYAWLERRSNLRKAKSDVLVNKILSSDVSFVDSEIFIPSTLGQKNHTSSTLNNAEKRNEVVFTVAMSETFMRRDVRNFVGTLRNTGFNGDIVVGIMKNSQEDFINALIEFNTIIYLIDVECKDITSDHRMCSLKQNNKNNNHEENPVKFSINMLRYYLYKWWSIKYTNPNTMILISDFRDVFFQSNPFKYRKELWNDDKSPYDLIIFQEAHPMKTILRCPFNSGWIKSCYGKDKLYQIGTFPVSCSGITIGLRDSILIYSHIMISQLNPKIRLGKNNKSNSKSLMTNKNCISLGMDQGFHNWLIYGGILNKFMNIKKFQQGEGPVSTIGAFYQGKNALLKYNLSEWKILRGKNDQKYISNWDNLPSPVVHQADRFLESDLKDDYTKHLKIFQKFVH